MAPAMKAAMGFLQFAFAQAAGTKAASAIVPRPNSAVIPSLYSGLMKAHADNLKVARKGDIDVLFLALDREEDVRKLLSLELTGAWINEAREIPKAIVDTLTGRVGRYPASW